MEDRAPLWISCGTETSARPWHHRMAIVLHYRLKDGLRPDVAGEKKDTSSTLGRLPDTTSYHLLVASQARA